MKDKLLSIYHKEMFNPKLIGLFINPFFITRKALFNGIQKNAHLLKGKLLDFGCGRKPYKDLFEVDEYIGLDIKESGHDHKNENIDVYYNGEKIPFEKNYFDCVFSSEAFQCVFELDNILNEINRVCKPNGYLLITVPFIWDENEMPYDCARYTSSGIKYLLEKNNFEIIKLTKSTNFVETLFQMWNTYIYHILNYRIVQLFLNPIIITPITIIGTIVSKILPNIGGFYHNNIVLAKKIK